MPRERYRPIGDYGIIGDMRTCALVARDGSIDWLCLPRFDSPSVFGRLLDADAGGYWRLGPEGAPDGIQYYEPRTNVLVTRYETEVGVVEVTDFMPCLEWDRQLASHHEIHRHVRAIEGRVRMESVLRPRFDYALHETHFDLRRHGILATDGIDEVLTLAGDRSHVWRIDEARGEARSVCEVAPGEDAWFVLRYDDDEIWPPHAYETRDKLRNTRLFWLSWAEDLAYHGEYEALVVRSALVLKLLFYAPTGAIVAAATTSLPEEIGGQRNWDYRFSWLRDSTFTLFGLHALGKFRELDRYMVYLKKICRRRSNDHRQIMFGVGGERDLPERTLDHLEGYRGSSPVRVGNAAVHQFQLDVYGEVMDSVHIWRRDHEMTEGMWALSQSLVADVLRLWKKPDLGPWEVRSEPRHFVFSKVMAWVTLDRAIRAAEDLDLPGDVETWKRVREEIHADVVENGWNEDVGAFAQHYDTDRMDAANLLIGILRFLPHEDPRVVGTIDRIAEELREPRTGLLFRYLTSDGVPGTEGCFLVNQFQLSQAYALSGRVRKAREEFERGIAYASPLGLLSEEVDPSTGELVGNFPQAFSHIGLINAAHVLSRSRQDVPADDVTMLSEDGG
ncbi:MAG: glycoside hydrolase family 15 protein [Gemmatimonadales bacterium]|jgi:GH15 family glucan-1,4-alpha-glucosidase